MTHIETKAESAARAAREHPQPICTDFQVQPEPSAFWCGHCGWNRPLHDDDAYRQAIAAELAKNGTQS